MVDLLITIYSPWLIIRPSGICLLATEEDSRTKYDRKEIKAENGAVATGKPCGRPLGSTKKPKVSLIGTLEMLDTMKKV